MRVSQRVCRCIFLRDTLHLTSAPLRWKMDSGTGFERTSLIAVRALAVALIFLAAAGGPRTAPPLPDPQAARANSRAAGTKS